MKRLAFILIASVAFYNCSTAQVDLKKIKKNVEKKVSTTTKPGGLTNDEIIQGLKEALRVGSSNASTNASKVDAYYKNTRLFIPFPPEANEAAKKLREIGMGKQVDQFILTMNRAAETAAKDAAPIFFDAVKNMSISDALNILNGADNAATTYLKI